MEWRPRLRRARFAFQPWRYEFEYARAWREADFQLYTLASPKPDRRRFGGKGRGGVMPRRPFHRLPMWLWSDLINLEAIETGSDWQVRISSQDEAIVPVMRSSEFLSAEREWASEGRDRDVELDRVDIVVDGEPVEYHGMSIVGEWWGAPVRGRAPIVTITGLAPGSIALATLADPTEHLRKAA